MTLEQFDWHGDPYLVDGPFSRFAEYHGARVNLVASHDVIQRDIDEIFAVSTAHMRAFS